MQHRVEIGGVPYLMTPNEWGWALSPQSSKTDRFHRNHLVTTDERGLPMKCSCPHCFHRQAFCKHMRCVETFVRKNSDEERAALRDAAIMAGIVDPRD